MASEEHKELARFVKEVHSDLRKASTKYGAEGAWRIHCKNEAILEKYAQSMSKLATTHWEDNSNTNSSVVSRIKWTADFCYDYFINKTFTTFKKKEAEIANKRDLILDVVEQYMHPLRLLDVGSCYNPFKIYEYFDVTAIDLYPANKSVFKCDFLSVPIGSSLRASEFELEQLEENFFEVVAFCFLLEYIPSSDLRINACKKAHRILKPGGLLIINTPDSKHVGANSKLMKCWQYTLALIGFTRIKYEKFKHMHCMAFRKAVCKDTAVRWADINRKPYMEQAIHIPQDFNLQTEISYVNNDEIEATPEDFEELPFYDL